VALSPLGLAADAAGGVRAGVEPALGYGVTAIHALSVAGLVDAGQRGEHPVTLVAGGHEDRLGAVGLGENGSRVARIRRIPRATVVSTGVLASRPRALGSTGLLWHQAMCCAAADSEQLAGRPLTASGSLA
jgi:hypothetical protein